MSGDNDYTGDTHIAESGLAVNGAIQNLIVEKGGAIILNDEAGALKIRGDATFDDQSHIYLKADADGTIDPLKIDGKATMNAPCSISFRQKISMPKRLVTRFSAQRADGEMVPPCAF